MYEIATPNNQHGYSRVPSQARITKLLIYETGAYQDQWRRPYSTNPDGHVFGMFKEHLDGLDHYATANLGSIAQSFLKPASQVDTRTDKIGIPQGWDTRRTRFMMEVEYDHAIGVASRQILTGYTTHVGALPMHGVNGSTNGATYLNVDNDMQFIVNSITPLQTRDEFGPQGHIQHVEVIKPSHVLADNNFTTIYQPDFNERMRPQDLFTVMSRSHVHRVRDDHGNIAGVGSPTLFDGRTVTTKSAALSLRSNVVPSAYVARVMENYNNARVAANDTTQAGGDFYQKARGYSQDGLISQNEVLRMISEIRGEPIGNIFQFKDLVRLDPTIVGRAVGRVSGMTEPLGGLHSVGMSSEWYGRDPMTMAATIISQCVPGIMSELALTHIGFKTHNEFAQSGQYSSVDPSTWLGRQNYQPWFQPYNIQGFGGQNMSKEMQIFETRFWNEVMKDLCQDNQVKFTLDVDCNLMGETVVTIGLDGKNPISYVTPSFADALMTPLVTNNHDHVVNVADDFSTMLQVVLPTDQLDTYGGPLFGDKF